MGAGVHAARKFDTLSWRREAAWSWYPDDHIGRPAGSARANPVARRTVEEPRVALSTPWSLDANALGTNDFRSTKANVREASLSAGPGRAWRVVSADAGQSVRAWVDGDRFACSWRASTRAASTSSSLRTTAPSAGRSRRGNVIASSFRLVMRAGEE